MTLERIVRDLGLERLTPELTENEKAEISLAHASDLLSDVLAHAPRGGVLVTSQTHMNVVAVALHAEQSGVIFSSGMSPEAAVRERATAEGLPLFATREATFDVAGKLYVAGLRGGHG